MSTSSPIDFGQCLTTVYAVFTAGHHAPVGELDARLDLADEGVRLGRVLVELMPDEGECVGLLALALATNARRLARTDSDGEIVLLADQDRALWDHEAIAEASALVESVLRRGRPGAYQMQAAIACLHGVAPTYAETDWQQIAEIYRMLEVRWPTPVVRVNRAVAEAEVAGPRAGLELLADLIGTSTERWHLYWSTRADFERRLGDNASGRGRVSASPGVPLQRQRPPIPAATTRRGRPRLSVSVPPGWAANTPIGLDGTETLAWPRFGAVLDEPFVSPPFDPEISPYGGEERDVVNWLLDYQRYVLLRKVDRITEEQARMTTASSDLTLLGLVRHLAEVEQYWLGTVFLGMNESMPWEDPDDRDADFHPVASDTLADALVLLRAEMGRARQLASTAPFDALSVGRRENQQVKLRWILVHLIEEYARHCGHADLLREAIDGVTGD